MYSFLLSFYKIALWFYAAERLEEETQAQRKLRRKLAKPLSYYYFTLVKSRGRTHAAELLSPRDVASGQSVRSEVSG